MILHFHLNKYWFFQIQNGKKRTEFRKMSPTWNKKVYEINDKKMLPLKALFYLGYPKKGDKSRVIEKIITSVRVVDKSGLPCDVLEFFIKNEKDFEKFVLSNNLWYAFDFENVDESNRSLPVMKIFLPEDLK
jgi:hypothetical protein